MVEYGPQSKSNDKVFSILILSWNNLSFQKLCIKSIQNNSSYNHQIIVHVNEGTDGTLEWVKSEPLLNYTYSNKNIGVCYALNAMRNLVKTDYLVFVNDDMYLCPNWDTHLLDAIKTRTDDLFFYSSTVIEPEWTRNSCWIAPKDYGASPADFKEDDLLKEFESLDKEDWTGATWPPNVVSTRLWDMVGGYSTEFSPGMYSDPDFSMKPSQVGVRDFRGIAKSRAYHFMSKTVGRIKKNNVSKQFLLKWQMTSSTFVKFYLKRGTKYDGSLSEPIVTGDLKMKLFINKLKRIFTV